MVTISIDGSDLQRVVSGSISLPRIGTWHLEAKVDSDVDITEDVPATVSINGGELDLVGTVTRAIDYQGITQVRVVGGVATADDSGARGLQQLAAPRFYTQATVGAILGDLLRDCGNATAIDADIDMLGTTLPSWTTIKAPIGRQIAELLRPLAAAWRMKPDGTLWVGAETWPDAAIASDDWQTIEYDHWNGIIRFGLLSPTLLPGTTIGGYRADRVEHPITGDSVTASVWEPRDDGARIDRDLVALGRGGVRPFDFLALYTGAVSAQSDQAFDVKPDDDRLPAMAKLPIRHGFPGLTVTVASGARLLVGWQDGNPRLPYCALWGGGETVQAATMVADKIQLGADGLTPAQNGVVLGACVDPFTGATHFALGGASSAVMAKP